MSPCKNAKNLGVIFDSTFSFSDHVSALCKACFPKIRVLSRVRRYLNTKAATMLANSLVSSKLDYCNSLLSSVAMKDMRRLQLLQNTLCRIVCRLPWRSHVSNHLQSLHWLPIKFRIDFKIGVVVFKTLQYGLPKYLDEYLALYNPASTHVEVILSTDF